MAESKIVRIYFPDLMVCLNKSTLKTIDISENFPPLYSGRNITANTLTKNDPNLIVFAFVASNTKEYLIDVQNKYEDIPLGYLAQKIGQLKLLGFHPITVNFAFLLRPPSRNVNYY